jgi:hypothetical protein
MGKGWDLGQVAGGGGERVHERAGLRDDEQPGRHLVEAASGGGRWRLRHHLIRQQVEARRLPRLAVGADVVCTGEVARRSFPTFAFVRAFNFDMGAWLTHGLV